MRSASGQLDSVSACSSFQRAFSSPGNFRILGEIRIQQETATMCNRMFRTSAWNQAHACVRSADDAGRARLRTERYVQRRDRDVADGDVDRAHVTAAGFGRDVFAGTGKRRRTRHLGFLRRRIGRLDFPGATNYR